MPDRASIGSDPGDVPAQLPEDMRHFLLTRGTMLQHAGTSRSKYPPAEPEALRLLAPQRGLFATGHGARERRCTDVSDARSNGKEHTPGKVKL